jgi:L-aspartate oxidase
LTDSVLAASGITGISSEAPSGSPTILPAAEVVVVGAGAAGLYTALVAAEEGSSVRLVSSSPLSESASYRAQGGLAAALADDDDPALHVRDTLAAARGAARESAVRILCDEAPERVRELERREVPFDRDPDGALALGLEGGHSRRRVVHAGGSATGRRIADTLSAAALASDRIEVHERTSAAALWVADGRCAGVVTADAAMPAAATVLGTGGAAALWRRTTNPRGAVGAGMLLARAAGAALADLELLQFHPTALVLDGPHDGFLITEAVRGEGATLLGADGERFVDELAPRDEVALAVQAELERSGREAVALDLRHVDLSGFPNIVATLREAGIDPTREPVPVAPAAHYAIGGVVADEHGRSTLPGLYAVGECACSGVHGANRLASNSLSECFVFGRRAALAAAGEPRPSSALPPAPRPAPLPLPGDATRTALWRLAGISREREGLARLCDDPHPLARLVARGALAREESRGCHLRLDYPATDSALDRMHYVFPGGADQPAAQRWE